MNEQIFLTKIGSSIYLRFKGHMTALLCTNAKMEFREIISSSTTAVYLDFKECEYMDSTFIGLLVILNKLTQNTTGLNMMYRGMHEPCRSLLDSSGVLTLLDVMENDIDWPDSDKEYEIPAIENRDADILLESHEELSGLNEKNAEKFRLLQKILQKRQSERE
jgi:anti-anti-sigma factor